MIKRSTKIHIQSILEKNKSWNVLDIGCGYSANKFANTICDVQDLSSFYKDKNFIKLDDKELPFENNHFDFVITSHVMEHVENLSFFISEIERVSKKGYIELPTKLEDNLVFENKKAHIWHLVFDDVNNKLNISKKIQYIEPILTVSTIKKLNDYFRESLIIELWWEDSIEFNIIENNPKISEKISTLNLLKKYF